jgi:GNAT superfamily N-acetyltransferase
MGITYREFKWTDTDYELLAELVGDRQGPKSVEDLRALDASCPAEACRVREFILSEGRCVGESVQYKYATADGVIHCFFFTLLPECLGCGLDEVVLTDLIEKARVRGAGKMSTNALDDDAGRIAALELLGFDYATGLVESRLDLARFDSSPVADKIRGVEDLGVTVRSAGELDEVGIDWLRLRFDWMRDYMAEEHPSELRVEQPYDEYRAEVTASKEWFPAADYAAFDGEECVGITCLSFVEGEPGTAWTGLTNVAKPYRRKGVATALKVASLLAARREGIRSVGTINEAHIPMLQLNVQLGFEKVEATVCYGKTIEAA